MDKRIFYAYPPIEALRQSLLQDNRQLEILDFGAGSRQHTNRIRKVKDIARSSLKPAKFGQLLFRMVNHYGPLQVLELGTSFGITTAYLASANPQAGITTIEGAPAKWHSVIQVVIAYGKDTGRTNSCIPAKSGWNNVVALFVPS